MESMRALWLALPACLFIACGGKSEGDGAGGVGNSPASGGDANESGLTGGSGGNTGGSAGSKGGSAGSGALGGNDGGASAFGGTGANGGAGALGGSAGSKGGTAGDAGTAGVGGGCCLAYPACPPGSTEVPVSEPCPPGRTCEDVSICCSTIRCASSMAQCNAFPTCDQGDSQVMDTDCAGDAGCYTRTLCGNTILCSDDFCDPESEYNLHYVSTGSCALIDYSCPAQTEYFANHCGCGCAQDPSCPPAIDCEPGPEPNPNCTEEILARCPYSPRGL